MSEPKYWLVGKVSVPEEEKAELNSAVLEVLNLCGIRKKKEITLAGKPITVLERPSVDENGIVEFDYSIFEKKSRICSTYDTKSCTLETREQGYSEFGVTMNLIMVLIECYCEGSCYFMIDRELVRIRGYLVLISTLLQRKIKANSRGKLWDILRFMRKHPECNMPKLREILFNLPWDYADLDFQQLRAGLVIEDLEISSTEDVITERGQITGASHKAKMDYLNKAMSIEYSEDRAALFQYLKKLLELPMDQRKEVAAADDNFGVIAELSLYMLPPCVVVAFSILDHADFWETWDALAIDGYRDAIDEPRENQEKDEPIQRLDFYKQIQREDQDEFLEFWDDENLNLSDSMKKRIQSWKELWESTQDDPVLDVESEMADLLTAMEHDWSCRYADAAFVELMIQNKDASEWRRSLRALRQIVDKGLKLFPELDRKTAIKWVKTYLGQFDMIAMAAFCSLMANETQRNRIFGF